MCLATAIIDRLQADRTFIFLQERLAAKAKREQMLLESFVKEEELPVLDDELALEAFNRRPSHTTHPSHAAQHAIVEHLSRSHSRAAQSAVNLIMKQLPDQKKEAELHLPKAPIRGVSIKFNGIRQLSELPGMKSIEYDESDFNAADYEDLQRDSGSDDMNDSDNDEDEDFDSD